jgi:geranylgeranyl diphosphate synthase type II
MGIEQILARRTKAVERELDRILARRDTLLYQAMRYAVLGGGKRFRPVLCLSTAAALGGDEALALPFACGLELIHNYSLVHDDLPCMDDDALRRGLPTCHREFGEDVALLAGDGLLTLAFEVMAAASVPRRLFAAKALVLHETARLAGVDGMIGGQLLDITYTAEAATEESLTELMIKKTGALIVESVRAGARIAGAKPAALKALTLYGENLGLAFQIRDDIHDADEAPRKGLPAAPNYARTFGPAPARERVALHVEAALAALAAGGIKSAELRGLARHLMER